MCSSVLHREGYLSQSAVRGAQETTLPSRLVVTSPTPPTAHRHTSQTPTHTECDFFIGLSTLPLLAMTRLVRNHGTFIEGFERVLKRLSSHSNQKILLITPGRIYKTASNHQGRIELRITTYIERTRSFKILAVGLEDGFY